MNINGTEISATSAMLAAIEAARAAGCEVQESPGKGFWTSTNTHSDRPGASTVFMVEMVPEFTVKDFCRLLGVDLRDRDLEGSYLSQKVMANALQLIVHPDMDANAEVYTGTVLAQVLFKRGSQWSTHRMPHVSASEGKTSAKFFV